MVRLGFGLFLLRLGAWEPWEEIRRLRWSDLHDCHGSWRPTTHPILCLCWLLAVEWGAGFQTCGRGVIDYVALGPDMLHLTLTFFFHPEFAINWHCLGAMCGLMRINRIHIIRIEWNDYIECNLGVQWVNCSNKKVRFFFILDFFSLNHPCWWAHFKWLSS